ncbi:MAG: hypothetical protein WD342_01735 [Verrucomicrobiales bacterium]
MDEKADIDPRDFLVEVDFGENANPKPLKIRVDYFACDDDERWCRTVTREFSVG